jgi:uncharacterized membrane protein YfcA
LLFDILISENKKQRRGDIKMKKIVMAAGAMAGIIAVQMGLSYVFGWKSAEIFSQIAVDVLFLSCLLMIGRRKVAK